MPTNPPNITALPSPPDPNDRSSFNVRAYPWSVAQQTLATEIAAAAANMYANAAEAVVSASSAAVGAGNASASAQAAAQSAAGALNAPGTSATSTSGVTVGEGMKQLVLTQLGKQFAVGQRLVAARTSNPTNVRMVGYVSLNNPMNGDIHLDVGAGDYKGTGTFSDWTISMAGEGNNLPQTTGADVGKLVGVVPGGGYGLVAGRGAGGNSVSGNATLTADSAAVQRITPTGPGQWIKLPWATTMPVGLGLFSLSNQGVWDVEVQNASGTALGYIQSGAIVGVSLQDASTMDGGWALQGATPLGVLSMDVGFAQSLGSSNSGQLRAVVEVDSTRDMLIYAGDARVYAQIWDSTASVLGSPVLVRTADVQARVRAAKSATDQVLCVSFNGGDANAMEAVILSVSGVNITVGTAAMATTAGGPQVFSDLVAVAGQGFVAATWRSAGNFVDLRAITLSGTTATIGTAVSQSTTANAPVLVFDAGAARILAFITDGNTVFIRPYAMAGTALTLGTAISISSPSSQFMARALASGRWALLFKNNSNVLAGAIVTLTGAVATQSNVALSAAAVPNAGGILAAHVVGSQVIVSALTSTPTPSINVLTDNAGTAVAGSEMAYTSGGDGGRMVACDATTMTVHMANGNLSATGRAMQIGISGNNPIVLAARNVDAGLYAEGGYSRPSNVWYGKDGLSQGVLRGNFASVAGLAVASTTVWLTTKGLPVFALAPLRNNSLTGFFGFPNQTRSAAGNYEWAAAIVTNGTLLAIQRVKVA